MLLSTFPLAFAVTGWTATCSTRDDPSIWFVFAQDASLPALPDYDCKGLFFDTVSCTATIGLGKIRSNELSPGGIPLFELRYLPYGDAFTITNFLNKPDGGVLYTVPPTAATSYAATPPPPTPAEWLRMYLTQRNKASAATKNVVLHIWSCPDAGFVPPDDAITPYGMTTSAHFGRAPVQ